MNWNLCEDHRGFYITQEHDENTISSHATREEATEAMFKAHCEWQEKAWAVQVVGNEIVCTQAPFLGRILFYSDHKPTRGEIERRIQEDPELSSGK